MAPAVAPQPLWRRAQVVSGLLSGFANVFFERILKKREAGREDPGFWPRQLQLALATAVFAAPAAPRGALRAFAELPTAVWSVILLKATGGLLIGATIKYQRRRRKLNETPV